MYITRQRIIPDLLIVQIYYRIDDDAKIVHLLPIRPVNLQAM